MTMCVYVDADHAGDQVTRRSRMGFIVFLNKETIYWSSKKINSCCYEASNRVHLRLAVQVKDDGYQG